MDCMEETNQASKIEVCIEFFSFTLGSLFSIKMPLFHCLSMYCSLFQLNILSSVCYVYLFSGNEDCISYGNAGSKFNSSACLLDCQRRT